MQCRLLQNFMIIYVVLAITYLLHHLHMCIIREVWSQLI